MGGASFSLLSAAPQGREIYHGPTGCQEHQKGCVKCEHPRVGGERQGNAAQTHMRLRSSWYSGRRLLRWPRQHVMLSTKKSEILPDQNTAELPTASCLSSQAKLKSRPRKMGAFTHKAAHSSRSCRTAAKHLSPTQPSCRRSTQHPACLCGAACHEAFAGQQHMVRRERGFTRAAQTLRRGTATCESMEAGWAGVYMLR